METDLAAACVRARVEVTSATESFGRHHPETAQALLALAGTARRAGDLDEAESAYRRAIAILQTQPEPDQAALGAACAAFGTLLVERGRLDDADHALDRAQLLLERALGRDHPDAAAVRARRRTIGDRQRRIPY